MRPRPAPAQAKGCLRDQTEASTPCSAVHDTQNTHGETRRANKAAEIPDQNPPFNHITRLHNIIHKDEHMRVHGTSKHLPNIESSDPQPLPAPYTELGTQDLKQNSSCQASRSPNATKDARQPIKPGRAVSSLQPQHPSCQQ